MKKIHVPILYLCGFLSIGAQSEKIVRNHSQITLNDGLSSNQVLTVRDDIFGRIWIGTSLGLNIYSGGEFVNETLYAGERITYLFNADDRMLISTPKYFEAYDYRKGVYKRLRNDDVDVGLVTSVLDLSGKLYALAGRKIYRIGADSLELVVENAPYKAITDKFGNIWGYDDDTVEQLDSTFNVRKYYQLHSTDGSPPTIMGLFADQKGVIWVGTRNDGVFRYNRSYDEFRKETLTPGFTAFDPENIGCLNEDEYGRLWIGHNSGVAVYDHDDGYFCNYMFEDNHHMLLNTIVTDILQTHGGSMALATYFNGFFYIRELDSPIRFHHIPPPGVRTGIVAANGITKDAQDRIWLGTNYAGINLYDSEGQFIRQLNQGNSGINDNISNIVFDGRGDLWAGSYSKGLYRMGTGEAIIHYTQKTGDENTLNGNIVTVLKWLGGDSLLVGTNRGLDLLTTGNGIFNHLQVSRDDEYLFYNLLELDGKAYAVNEKSIICYDRVQDTVTETGFGGDTLIYCGCIFRGQVILGGRDGNIFIYGGGRLEPFSPRINRLGNPISNMMADDDGRLWLTAGHELISIDGEKISWMDLSWCIADHEFNVRSVFKDRKGHIYFGTTNGFISFDPARVKTQKESQPLLYIADFRLFDRSVVPRESPVLDRHINSCPRIVLNHRDNFLSFTVNVVDFSPGPVPYRILYRLDGLDDNWFEMNRISNEIVFAGLPSGSYTLHIAALYDNGETAAAKTIGIRIRPHPLRSWYMILTYILFAGLLSWLISVFVRRHRKDRRMIESAKREHDETKQNNAKKIELFTHLSHEFMNQLSIIPALEDEVIPPEGSGNEEADMLRRNVRRLEFLIKQLVVFHNLESRLVKIEEGKYDAVVFFRGVFNTFVPLYRRKEIDYEFITDVESLTTVFDAGKLEMLMADLLSNILRYIESGGRCHVKLMHEGQRLRVDVFISGGPLTDEQKTMLFRPYNTVAADLHSDNDVRMDIVHSISRLLNIDLSVLRLNDEGNIIRLDMPIVENEKMVLDTARRCDMANRIIDNSSYAGDHESCVEEADDYLSKFTMLLVENDPDTCHIFRKRFREHINVITAINDKEALMILKAQSVDVVVIDIRMSQTDGYELCLEIKQSPQTRHLPILMISSDHSVEAKIKGFRAGADAFMHKPLIMEELILRLDNIFKSKNVMRDYYSRFEKMETEHREMNISDERFLLRLTSCIAENMGKSELSVNHVVQFLNISRTQLYHNVKRLTGKSPSAFILAMKMERASSMLSESDLTSSQISYDLGYCNPHHFSRQFKNFYGISPSQYRKQN